MTELQEKALKNLGIEKLNSMQEKAFKTISQKSDLILLSPTGTGKTLAFLLPFLSKLDPANQDVQLVILTPARELALQIESVFKKMGTEFKVNCCYGGHSMKIEKNNLLHPPAVLIGTPGRIADHLRNNRLNTEGINSIILDEFDKALEFGFQRDMEFIINELPGLNQRVLVSATEGEEIPEFTKITNPSTINYLEEGSSKSKLVLKGIRADGEEKIESLYKLICRVGNDPTIIFCNHRDAVERISKELNRAKIRHGVFHGGMKQEHRERELIKFRNKSIKILLATDLAARGLDIPEVKSIIHYQIPTQLDAFTHRNGRTARMNANGSAYIMFGEEDYKPEYIEEEIEEEIISSTQKPPVQPEWITLYLDSGKKDKIRKVDIVGLFLKKGGLENDELGLIAVQDYSSYIAVPTNKARNVLERLGNERIKKKKVKLSYSR